VRRRQPRVTEQAIRAAVSSVFRPLEEFAEYESDGTRSVPFTDDWENIGCYLDGFRVAAGQLASVLIPSVLDRIARVRALHTVEPVSIHGESATTCHGALLDLCKKGLRLSRPNGRTYEDYRGEVEIYACWVARLAKATNDELRHKLEMELLASSAQLKVTRARMRMRRGLEVGMLDKAACLVAKDLVREFGYFTLVKVAARMGLRASSVLSGRQRDGRWRYPELQKMLSAQRATIEARKEGLRRSRG
jgi:hypothetical protein